MTDLSPAACAVLKAACIHHGLFNEEIVQRRRMIAAALRAASYQAAPEKQLKDIAYIHESYVYGMRDALACIEIIADELEAQ